MDICMYTKRIEIDTFPIRIENQKCNTKKKCYEHDCAAKSLKAGNLWSLEEFARHIEAHLSVSLPMPPKRQMWHTGKLEFGRQKLYCSKHVYEWIDYLQYATTAYSLGMNK